MATATLARPSSRPVRVRKTRTLSRVQEDRLHNAVSKITPSEPWHRICRAAVYDPASPVRYRDDADEQARELSRRGVFPPPADHRESQMKACECRDCDGRRLWPAAYVRSVVLNGRRMEWSADCWEDYKAPKDQSERTHGTTSSPSAAVQEVMADRCAEVVEMPLEPESEAALRSEIAAFELKASGPAYAAQASRYLGI